MNGHLEDRILYLPSPNPEQEFRLHLDENISAAIAGLLRDRGYDVTTTSDVGLRAQSDASHMNYAVEQQRIIVTRDRDFLQLHAQDYEHSGIVYWPHNEAAPLSHMQELLVKLLQRVSKSPTRGAEIAANGTWPQKKRQRKQSKKRNRSSVSNELPPGIVVQGTVRSSKDQVLEVQLDSGQAAYVLPHRLAAHVPQLGDAIEAVTAGYIKSRKELHLSMRREYSLARTVVASGLKQLRCSDHALMREIHSRWPVELELERNHILRIYGVTADAVRDASHHLQRQIPWAASAIVKLDKGTLQSWMRRAFGGGVGKMSQATGALVRHHRLKGLVVCAKSNRDLESVLKLLDTNIPDMRVIEMQAARGEPLMRCCWEER